jgi:hypothetical protein
LAANFSGLSQLPTLPLAPFLCVYGETTDVVLWERKQLLECMSEHVILQLCTACYERKDVNSFANVEIFPSISICVSAKGKWETLRRFKPMESRCEQVVLKK